MSVGKGNKWIREHNKRLIIERLMDFCLSRSDLARETKLAPSTVTALVGELLDEGLLFESDQSITTAGRPKRLLSLREDYPLIFLLSISRSQLILYQYNVRAVELSQEIIELSPMGKTNEEPGGLGRSSVPDQAQLAELIEALCLRGPRPVYLHLLYAEDFSPAQRMVYAEDWGQGVNISLAEYLSSALCLQVKENELNEFAYWAAFPELGERYVVLSIGEETDLKLFVHNQELTLEPQYLAEQLASPQELLVLIQTLCLLFGIRDLVLAMRSTAGRARLLDLMRLFETRFAKSLEEQTLRLYVQSDNQWLQVSRFIASRFARQQIYIQDL